MADPRPEDTILRLFAENTKARIAIRAPENANRKDKPINRCSDTSLRLCFNVQPKNIHDGFVFGTDSTCDVFLPGEYVSRRHFAITFHPSSGKLQVVNMSSTAITVGSTVLLEECARKIKRSTVIDCAGFLFSALVPNRGRCHAYYEQKVSKYLEYFQNDEPLVLSNFLTRGIVSRSEVGPFLEVENFGSRGFGESLLFVHGRTGDAFSAKRFRRPKNIAAIKQKVDTLKGLSHNKIVKFSDSIMDNTSLCLFMTHIPHSRLNEHGDLETFEIVEILSQCLDALEYLHSHGITHQDIRPANIALQHEFPIKVKIADFGFARESVSAQSATKTGLYVAPEVWAGKACGHAMDIWSLGLTALELLARLPGREANMFRHNRECLPDYLSAIRRKYKALPDPISRFFEGMLQVNPKNRWSARECLERLKLVQQAITVENPTAMNHAEINRRRTNHRPIRKVQRTPPARPRPERSLVKRDHHLNRQRPAVGKRFFLIERRRRG